MDPQKDGIHGVVLSLIDPRAAAERGGLSKSASDKAFDLEKSAALSARLKAVLEKDGAGDPAPAVGSITLREKVASLTGKQPAETGDPVLGALKQRIRSFSASSMSKSASATPESPTPASPPETEAKTPGNGEALRAKLVAFIEAKNSSGGEA
jgi:hypothetical protein